MTESDNAKNNFERFYDKSIIADGVEFIGIWDFHGMTYLHLNWN